MTVFFYNLVIQIYFISIRIAAISGNEKAGLWIEGRKNLFSVIKSKLNVDEKHIWVHCASLGEFEQGRPLIEKLKEKYPEKKIILTFFSPSGYEIRKNYDKVDFVFYLPLDTLKNAKTFIELINPELVVFVKYEYWYHYLNELRKIHIPVILISAVLREDHWLLGKWGRMHLKVLRKINHFFVQDDKTMQLLNDKNIHQVTVAGDTRFDRVWDVVQNSKNISIAEKFSGGKKCIVAGSTWEMDEELLAEYLIHNKEIKLIVAPHEINEEHLKSIENKFNSAIRFSGANEKTVSDFDVLIIDNIGMLSSLYTYADATYVGGGFGKGIHNILEPAAHAKPVIFGPNHKKFREAGMLIDVGAGFEINNYEELKSVLDKFFSDEEYLKGCSEKAGNFVRSNKGATEIISNYLTEELKTV
ncbi:MAG: 3-deoxy-D-manno-octulosonic acid transferase [Nitrosopumilus sp.]|nr:3-deoxy-D-manno-octulosonic acid transferase [Nitrosopumilus sp.]